MTRLNTDKKGFVLPVFLITTLLIAVILAVVMNMATYDYRLSTREYHKVNAQFAADAGLDHALVQLTADSDWLGSGGEITLLDNGNTKTTYETVVSDGAEETRKIIAVTSRTYSPVTATEPKLVRNYEIDVEAVTSGDVGPTSVASGVGGLILNNNSKISGGDVVVNGKITMSNQSQIGLQSNPVNVRVAHQNCPVPADSTYPRTCNSSENGQPILLSNNARIYGDVRATNQTNGNNMFDPGLVASQTVAPLTLPAYDRAAHKAAAGVTQTPAESACPNNGAKSWPANLRITGNVTVSNNCTLTINGNVWVEGNLTLTNQARIIVPDTLGSDRPVIMADGSSGFRMTNNARIMPNSSGTGVEVVTFWSAADCSPDCTDVTGADLAASQGVTTINMGNQGSAQNSVFYAPWSKVYISNNGALGAVAGQTVELGNQAVISFTASIPGSDNRITTWVKRGYMRTYN